MYKIKNDLSSLIVTEPFEQRDEQHYDLRNNSQFTIPPIKTVYQGSECISFLGPKIWNILPLRLKNASSIEAFKNNATKTMEARKWSMSALQGLCSKCRFCLREFP